MTRSKTPARRPRAASTSSAKTRRIFVSMPADQWLTPEENRTKWAIVGAIEKLGYTTEVFLDPRGTRSLASSQAWSAVACRDVMRRCDGCVLIGLARWRFQGADGEVRLSTEFSHYEGAVAHTIGLPLLVLVQESVLPRVVFDPGYKGYVAKIPAKPTPKWLSSRPFKVAFGHWREELEARRDVFLGYCSSSHTTARALKRFLRDDLGLRVLDWATDFDPATSILHQIDEAARRCGAGVFLFTKDDQLADKGSRDRAAPRDNVVFEAGYFIGLKGKPRVLIVRETDAKMPADLGGDIYASLKDKTHIAAVKSVLAKFAKAL